MPINISDHAKAEAEATRMAVDRLSLELLAYVRVDRRTFTSYLRKYAEKIDDQTDEDFATGYSNSARRLRRASFAQGDLPPSVRAPERMDPRD